MANILDNLFGSTSDQRHIVRGLGEEEHGQDLVTITDQSGESYNVPASAFNDTNKYGDVTKFSGQKLYSGVDGKLSLTPVFTDKSKAIVTLDRESGDIKVKAPKVLADREFYNESIVPLLESISADYKNNPDTKYTDPNDPNKVSSIEDKIKEIEEGLNSYVPSAYEINRNIFNIKNQYGLDISDSQAMMRMTTATRYIDENGNVTDPKDTAVQVLPTSLFDSSTLGGLESYDANNSAVTFKDLKDKIWSRIDSSEEEMWELYGKTKDLINDQNADTDERLRAMALMDFMNDQKPEMTFWNGVGDWFEGQFVSVGSEAVDILSAVESAENSFSNLVDNLYYGEEEAKKYHDIYGKNEIGYFSGEVLQSFNDWKEEYHQRQKLFKSDSAAIGEMIGTIGLKILESIAASKIAGKVASKITSTAVGIAEKASEFAKATEIAGAVTKGAEEMQNIAKGAKLLVDILGASKAVSLVKSTASALSFASTAVSTVANLEPLKIFGESIVEAFTTRPDLVRKLMSSTDGADTEAQNAVMEELAWNVAGWGAGLGLEKAFTVFRESAAGQAISGNMSKRINDITSKLGEVSEKARVKFTRGANNLDDVINHFQKTNPKKAQALLDRYLLRDAKRALSEVDSIRWVGRSSDDVLEDIRRFNEEYTIPLRRVHNAVDDWMTNGRLSMELFMDSNAEINIAIEKGAFFKSVSDVIDIEDELAKRGMKLFAPIAKKADDVMSAGILSQTTTNYVGATMTMTYWTRWMDNIPAGTSAEFIKSVQETIDEAKIQISTFVDNATPELKAAADSLIADNRVLWHKLEDVYKKYGLENSNRIAGLRNNELFGVDGSDWYSVQRKAEFSQRTQRRAAISSTSGSMDVDPEIDDWSWSRKAGAKGDYIDPSIVLYDSMHEHALLKNHNDLYEAFSIGTGQTNAVLVGAEGTEYARVMDSMWGEKRLKTAFKDTGKDALRVLNEELSEAGVLSTEIGTKIRRGMLAQAEKQAERASTDVAKAQVKKIATNVNDRISAIKGIGKEEIDQLMGQYTVMGSNLDNLIVDSDSFDEFVGMLSPQSRTFLRKKVKDYQYTVGPENIGGITRSDLKKINYEDYTRVTGQKWKDIPSHLRPYISKNGITFDSSDWAEMFGRYDWGSGSGAFDMSADDILDVYDRVLGVEESTRLLSYDNFQKLRGFDSNFEYDFKRNILENTKEARDSNIIANIAAEEKRSRIIAEADLIYKKQTDKVAEMAKQFNIEARNTEIVEDIDAVLDDTVRFISEQPECQKVFEAVAERFGFELDQTAKNYLSLKMLTDNKAAFEETLNKSFNTQLKDVRAAYGKKAKEYSKYEKGLYNEYSKLAEDILTDKFNTARIAMHEIAPDAVDVRDWFSEIADIKKDISAASQATDVIMTTNRLGQVEYVQVNPLLAEIINTKPIYKEPGNFAKFNYLTNRLFRMGTTGPLAFKSLTNQLFKDSINAYVGGGMVMTSKQLISNMTEEFGDDIVRFIMEYEPEAYERLAKQSVETGESLAKLAAERELAGAQSYLRAQERTVAETLTSEYSYTKYIDGTQDKGNLIDRAIKWVDDKISSDTWLNPDKINQFREDTLRNLVYKNAYYDAMKKGMSLTDARIYARNLMSNATTNFTRKTVFLSKIQSTTPYFGAAINGQRSFWRLVSLDPVGVFSRMAQGVIAPVVGLTVASLADERNRTAWRNLKEYNKNGNLIFAINGQIISIPLPEEMGALVDPIRQMVESMYGVNRHDFWDLATNDILGIFPIDMTGFSSVDAEDLTRDDTWYNRINFNRGISKLASAVMPPLIKSGVIYASGVDPYTGNRIDRSYVEYDPDSGEYVTKSDYSGQFSKILAQLANNLGWELSAPMAEALTSGILGSGGLDFLNVLTNYAQLAMGNESAKADMLPQLLIERTVVDPLTVSTYDAANSAWNKAVTQLYLEKEELLSSDKFISVTKNINSATSETAKAKAIAERNNLVDEYYNNIKTVVDNLNSRYGAEFDGNKFATVLSLVNLSADSTLANINALDVSTNQDLKSEGKRQAVATMERLGFTSPSDTSLFGKIAYNSKTGETFVSYTTPIEIMNAKNAVYYSGEIHLESIKSILDSLDLKTVASATYGDDYKAAKAKGKSALKAYKANWNARVINAINPYVQKYGANEVLTSNTVMELYKYLWVDNSYVDKNAIKSLFTKGD